MAPMQASSLPGIRTLQSPRFRLVLSWTLFAAALLHLAQVLLESWENMTDFRLIFIPEARQAWSGSSPYHHLGYRATDQFFSVTEGSNHSPALLFFLWPWTVLPDPLGRVLMLVLGVCAIVVIVLCVSRGLNMTGAETLTATSLLLFYPPLADSLREGQVSLLIGAAVAFALFAHQRNRPIPGGVVFGLAIAFQLAPALLLAYFAYRRSWRLCIIAILTVTGVVVATFVAGWGSYWFGFVPVLIEISAGSANVLNQSLNGFLLRLWRPELSGLPIPSPGIKYRLVWGAGQIALVALATLEIRRARLPRPIAEWTEIAIVLLAFVLILPFAWAHYFAVASLAVPVTVYLVSRRLMYAPAAAVASAAFLAAVLFEYDLFVRARALGGAQIGRHPLELIGGSLAFLCALAGLLAFLGLRAPASGNLVPNDGRSRDGLS